MYQYTSWEQSLAGWWWSWMVRRVKPWLIQTFFPTGSSSQTNTRALCNATGGNTESIGKLVDAWTSLLSRLKYSFFFFSSSSFSHSSSSYHPPPTYPPTSLPTSLPIYLLVYPGTFSSFYFYPFSFFLIFFSPLFSFSSSSPRRPTFRCWKR